MPKFSIVMPCYNAAATLSETIESIQAQTNADWELICVDDWSTDQTCAMILEASKRDNRIKLICNDGKGPSHGRNLGAMRIASGEIIAFCDADDIWEPSKLANLARFFSDTIYDATFGQIAFFDGDPTQAKTLSTVPAGQLTIDDLLAENPVCTMSNLSIRKDSLFRFGGFDSNVVHNEDLEWLIRVVGQGGTIVGQASLQVWYRSSATGLSANLPAMEAGRAYAIRTAAQFGFRPSRAANAIHKRYLARRALRMGHGRRAAAELAIAGLIQSPTGFMTPPQRGALTLIGALTNLFLPRSLSRAIFS